MFDSRIDLDKTKGYYELKKLTPPNLKTELTPERIQSYRIQTQHLQFSYATSLVSDQTIDLFKELVKEQEIVQQYTQLRAGQKANLFEDRQVNHHHCREKEKKGIYQEQQHRISELVSEIQSGKITAKNGNAYTNVVQIGIGGSELGPKALYLGLKEYAKSAFQTNVSG